MAGCDGWAAVNPLCQAGHVLGGAAASAGTGFFGSIADYFSEVARDAVGWLWTQLDTATSIDVTSAGVRHDLVATAAIAALISSGLFLIQVIASTLRQDGAGLGRGVRGLAVSFLGAAFAIASTQILLAAVDSLCNGVVEFALHTTVQGLGEKLLATEVLTSIGNPAGLLLMSLVLLAAVVVVWLAVMIRKLLIIVSAVFAPIAFAGASSDISRSWVRRWIEFTVALIFSKLVLVIIFMIGLSVLDGAGQSTTRSHTASTAITTLVIGALTLLLASFAPWIAIKMVHFTGEPFHAVHAQAAGVTTGARTAAAVPQKVMAVARPAAAAAGAGSGAGTAGMAARAGAQPKSGAGPGSTPGLGAGIPAASGAVGGAHGAATRPSGSAAPAASSGTPRATNPAGPTRVPRSAEGGQR